MPDYPTSAKEVGHNHEVEPRVLGERLRDARDSAAYWKRQEVQAESPVHRVRAAGLNKLWTKQVVEIERELRRRGTLNPA